ncbi:MAG: hypothetical protein AAGF31_08025 [Planctomycetota bacterium]
MARTPNRLLLSPVCLLLIASVVVTGFAPMAEAQRGPQVDEVDNSPALRRSGTVVKNWVKRPSGNPAEEQQFEDYFDKYYFPTMTQTSPDALGELGKLRYDLFRQYIDPAAPEVRKKLTEKAYAFANRVIRGRYHRAVKYNAVLILGSLTTDGTTPLPAASTFLCRISGFASKGRLPGYMQAGALVGLSQHAAVIDRLPEEQQKLTLAALAEATTKEAVAGTGGKLTQDWLRSRAAAAIAVAAKQLDTGAPAPLIVKLIGDDSMTLNARCTVAGTLEGLKLPPDGSAAKTLLELASEVAKDEAEEANEFEELQISSRGTRSAMQFNKSQRYMLDPVESRVVYLREGLAGRLEPLRRGLQASLATAGDSAPAVETAVSAISKVLEVATSNDTIDLDVAAAVKSMATSLQNTPPAAAAEEADSGDETDLPDEAADLF